MSERKSRSAPTKTNSGSLFGMVKKGLKNRGFIYVTAGNLVNAVLGGVFYLLAARMLGVSDYGYLNYYLSLGFFLSSIPILGLSSTISAFYPKEEKDDLITESTLLTFILGIVVGVAATLYILFFPAQTGSNSTANLQISIQLLYSGNPYFISVFPTILDSLQSWIQMVTGGNIAFVFAIPLILGLVFFILVTARALGRREYKKYALINSFVRVLEIGLVVIFYFLSAISVFPFDSLNKLMLVAYIAPFFLVSYDYFKDLFSVKRTSFHFSEIRDKMAFTLHTWGIGLAQASHSSLDKVVIGFFFGLLFLGLYNLAYQFLLIFLIIPASVLSYLLPEKSGGAPRREVEVISLLLAVGITVLGILLSPTVINWLFPNFTNSIDATRWLAIAVIPATIASIKTSTLLSEERPRIVLIAYISALVVDIVGILLLGKTFQAVGFAWAFVLDQVACMIILLVLPSARLARIRNRNKSAVQVKKTKS
ncbi:MAG: oligosaccharide flippase family protein [Candidatus Freyarchaeum deiterrae]